MFLVYVQVPEQHLRAFFRLVSLAYRNTVVIWSYSYSWFLMHTSFHIRSAMIHVVFCTSTNTQYTSKQMTAISYIYIYSYDRLLVL